MSTVCPAGQALNAKVGSEEHKDAVSEHARSSLIVILVAVFIDLLGVAIVIPLLPMFVKRVGLSSGAYGWLGAFYGVSQLLGSPLMGNLSDVVGKRFVLLVSAAGSGIAYLLMGYVPSMGVLFFSRLLIGFVKQTTSCAAAYISEMTTTDERSVMIGRMNMAVSLAFIVGPPIGGILSAYSHELPVSVAGVLFALECVLIKFCLSDPPKAPVNPHLKEHEQVEEKKPAFSGFLSAQWANIRACFGRPMLRAILITIMGVYTAVITMQHTTLLSLQERFSLDAKHNGYVMGYMGLSNAIVQGYFIKPLTTRYGDSSLIMYSCLMLSVGMMATAVVPSLFMWTVVYPVIAVPTAVLRTVLTSAATKAVDYYDKKEGISSSASGAGAILGIVGVLSSVARIIAPLASGQITESFGLQAVDVAISLLSILLASYHSIFQPFGTNALLTLPQTKKPKEVYDKTN